MAALQREQLNRLCSNSETLEKAQSILRLANAKTRPGSGFVVKNTIAIPAVCAYLVSEQLNTGEVSLQSAVSAACVAKAEFSDILKTTYSIQAKAFKAVVTILDKRCDVIAEQIKFYFKSSMKSTIRPLTATRKTLTPAISSSKKRADDSASFPETPTKKRRVDNSSPIKPRTSNSPTKRPSAVTTAAFHAALKGSPTKLPVGQESESPGAGPSTHVKVTESAATPVQAESQPSPSRSTQGPTSPARPVIPRRFRPVFLEQQQWCARDPKVERMWAVAETLRDKLVELHGHPFEGFCAR
ncbi:hypothetical protein OG21DRAFT_1603139 [Imleria badia]|nr:hypothetical protein OG21DRAFT_1603139 [Imleria badia]